MTFLLANLQRKSTKWNIFHINVKIKLSICCRNAKILHHLLQRCKIVRQKNCSTDQRLWLLCKLLGPEDNYTKWIFYRICSFHSVKASRIIYMTKHTALIISFIMYSSLTKKKSAGWVIFNDLSSSDKNQWCATSLATSSSNAAGVDGKLANTSE